MLLVAVIEKPIEYLVEISISNSIVHDATHKINTLRGKMNVMAKVKQLGKELDEFGLKLLVFAFVSFVAIYFLKENSDTWWQLRAGEALWNGTFSYEDSWSFTALGDFWPDHELGFQMLLYGLWWLGGGTFWVVVLFALGSLYLTARLLFPSKRLLTASRARFGTMTALAITVPLSVMAVFTSIRPSFLTFLLFALTLWLVTRNKPLWIPLAMLVWVNSHGSFILGIGVLGLGALLALIIAFKEKFSASAKKRLLPYLIAVPASFAVTLINPLGLDMWKFVLDAGSYSNSGVSEWQPFYTDVLSTLILVALVASLVVYAKRWRELVNKWELLVPFAVSAFMLVLTFAGARYISFFALAIVPLVYYLSSTAQQPQLERKHLSKPLVGVIAGVWVLLALGESLSWQLTASKNPFSPELKTYLTSEECAGATWNDYWTGGYLIWWERAIPVSIDSRFDLYSDEVKQVLAIRAARGTDILDNTEKLNVFLNEFEINCYLTTDAYGTDDDWLRHRGVEVIYSDATHTLFRLDNHTIPLEKAKNSL